MKRVAAWLVLCCALPAHAIDRIQLRAARVSAADFGATQLDATLQIQDATRSRLKARVASVQLPQSIEAATGALQDLQLQCANPLVLEPRFECPDLALQVTSSRWSAIEVGGKAAFRSDTGNYEGAGTGLMIAGRPLSFVVNGDMDGTQIKLDLDDLQLPQVQQFLVARKLPLPHLTYAGTASLDATITRRDGKFSAAADLAVRDAGYQNADLTLIGEKLSFNLHAAADLAGQPITFDTRISAGSGQALAGPMLLDFDKNPLQLTASGNYSPQGIQIRQFSSQQRDLASVTGSLQLGLAPFAVKDAVFDATDVRFPAAYTTFLQILLATTPFNQLEVTGTATLHAGVRENQLSRLDLSVTDLAFSDSSHDLKVNGIRSEVHWSRGVTGPPQPSWLSWQSSQGWGITGAPSRIDFIVQDRDFRLTRAARLPFFDGALRIITLAVEQVGTEQLSGVFDAVVEPISVAPIARAVGLPEFAGKLAGSIPGLTYKDKLLSLQGNLEADVFGGKVVASNLRIRDPLGAWPRLYGDVIARNLDLAQLTSTFEFGSITGKLDVDVTGIETFNWSPVALDLRLATPKDDRSKHRISQRAVQKLTDIGGGGGGVAAALQSPFLRFFDDFGYDRIGLGCRLRNNVCQMSGAGPAKNGGFYIVRGSGLPRLDIIGNNQLVDWPQFVSQVVDAIRNPGTIELK